MNVPEAFTILKPSLLWTGEQTGKFSFSHIVRRDGFGAHGEEIRVGVTLQREKWLAPSENLPTELFGLAFRCGISNQYLICQGCHKAISYQGSFF